MDRGAQEEPVGVEGDHGGGLVFPIAAGRDGDFCRDSRKDGDNLKTKMSRDFSRSQKQAVEIVTGRTGEADHIVPYSRGGKTEVENCQIISSATNQKKGAFLFQPREWQEMFFEQWRKRKNASAFLLVAVPGSGKTMAALEVARRWMLAGSDRRLMVVVPTDNLRTQWQEEAARFGIDLQSKEFGTNFKHGYQGGVTTYSSVANQRFIFRALCVAPTMVIFDEVHHCGQDSHWGEAIRHAFELAAEKLLMSGTPWKSDGTAIPFVSYDLNGMVVADYSYEYTDAIKDDVVRYLVFDYSKGVITNDINGTRLEVNNSISENQAGDRLRFLLDPDGEYVAKQIQDSHQKLMSIRQTIPDAAAMAVCADQRDAEKIAGVIKRITNCVPSVIVCDDEIANDTVADFRRSKKEWLVSVRKVSEGTDIKRLQVLCYLTNVTSELFFRQVIGRVSRVRDLEDHEGYVFLPADPRLIRCAENIESAQVIGLREQIKESISVDSEKRESSRCDFWSTEHTGTDLVLINGCEITEDAEEVKRLSEKWGVPMRAVIGILKDHRGNHAVNQNLTGLPLIGKSTQTRESQQNDWRKRINKMAYKLSKMLDVDPKNIHGRYKPQSMMSIEELEAKYNEIRKQLEDAANA